MDAEIKTEGTTETPEEGQDKATEDGGDEVAVKLADLEAALQETKGKLEEKDSQLSGVLKKSEELQDSLTNPDYLRYLATKDNVNEAVSSSGDEVEDIDWDLVTAKQLHKMVSKELSAQVGKVKDELGSEVELLKTHFGGLARATDFAVEMHENNGLRENFQKDESFKGRLRERAQVHPEKTIGEVYQMLRLEDLDSNDRTRVQSEKDKKKVVESKKADGEKDGLPALLARTKNMSKAEKSREAFKETFGRYPNVE